MSHLQLRLLGPTQVQLDGQPIAHCADTAQALLAYLAMHAGIPCRRTSLAGLLWSDYSQSSALTNLRQALRRLRTAIGDSDASPPYLLATRTTIALDPESDYSLDVDAFSEALDAARSHAHRSVETCPTCAERLAEAVELYRGEFLDGFALDSALFEEWMVVERERLHGQALEAVGHLAAYHEARGAYEEAAHYARRVLALEPWREEAHRALMRALALGGQRAVALAQYDACRDVLREELGVEPSEETTQLYERIRDGQDLTGFGKPVRSAGPSNLPAQLTPFVGRECELAEIAARLADPECRLLTLVGPGGSGKTRLALEAAARELAHYPHGVFFVPLAPLHSVEAIVPAVAQAIGLSAHGGGDPKRQLLYHLRDKQMLLLIDNLEHLLASPAEKESRRESAGEILLKVLRAAAGLQLLVTSRVRLNASMEYTLSVPGMNVPPSSGEHALKYSAVQLYLQQARHVQPNYQPNGEALAQIGRVCRLAGGMPLAILLAAAWMDVLSPGEIGAELEKSIAFLHSDLSDLPDRHRNIVVAFDVSWSLLSEMERDAFAALSVFRGGCTREAAQVVAGADLEILRALVRKSFLTRDEDGRYQVHELLRQYGADKLRQEPGAWERVCDRHCTYYAEYVGGRKDSFRRLGPGDACLEVDNMRVAWHWMLDRDKVAECRRALGGLCWFGDLVPAWKNVRRPLLERTIALLRRAEPSRENQIALGMALCYLSTDLSMTEESERGAALAREGHQILTELHARRELAEAKMLAFLGGMAEDDAQADRLLQEGLSLAQETDAPIEEAWALSLLGSRHLIRAILDGLPKEAWRWTQEAYDKALEIFRRIGHRRGEAIMLGAQADCAHAEGKYAEARSLCQESLILFRELDVRWWVLQTLRQSANVALTAGDHAEARAYYLEDLDKAQLWGSPTETQYALCGLGDVALATGAPRKAAEFYRLAVQEAIGGWVFSGTERIMLSMAKLSAQKRELTRAAELLALAYHIVHTYAAYSWGEVGFAGGRELERVLQQTLSPEAHAAAQERGKARNMKETLRELLVELEAELSKEVEGPSG